MEDIVYELDKLDGHAFEVAMVEVFRRLGYATERGKVTNDEGRDIIIWQGSEKIVVECKHHRDTIGRPQVQKLHSATMTYPGATGGIVVATSSFSDGAQQYVAEINAKSGIQIQLWDYAKLVQEAQRVGVYLVKTHQGTHLFFQAPFRNEQEVLTELSSRYLAGLVSKPRPVHTAIQIAISAPEIIPVAAIDYEVNKVFETQAGVIYRARESGRRLFPLRHGDLNAIEDTFWTKSHFEFLQEQAIQGKTVATYFGRSLEA